jgi:predicted NUDIX family NTP pyrophosphohydrolase
MTAGRRRASNSGSAGLLMFRWRDRKVEFLLAHPGGPFWKNKDLGAWTIPNGLIEEDEERLKAAEREFAEETSIKPRWPYVKLGSIRQKAGKIVHAWAFEGDADPAQLRGNLVAGGAFPEIDRCEWFDAALARQKLNPSQAAFIDRLVAYLFSGTSDREF